MFYQFILIIECHHLQRHKLQWRQEFFCVWFTTISPEPCTCLAQRRCTISIHCMNEMYVVWALTLRSRVSGNQKSGVRSLPAVCKAITSIRERKNNLGGGWKREVTAGETTASVGSVGGCKQENQSSGWIGMGRGIRDETRWPAQTREWDQHRSATGASKWG